ncbi:hypothetical protein CGCFRS4_v008456 [Colletotrichum fructicola]|nr:hypothetical protein CGCFRS4_v008456 [Colletotrichum fructicola]
MRKAPASVEKINGDDLQPTPRNKHEGRAGTGGSPAPRRVLVQRQTALHVNLPQLYCTLDGASSSQPETNVLPRLWPTYACVVCAILPSLRLP